MTNRKVATTTAEAETQSEPLTISQLADLAQQLLKIGKAFSPSNEENKKFYSDFAASVDAQKRALAGYPNRRPQ